jgi:hypothetical protein
MCTIDWNAVASWITAIATGSLAVLTWLTLLKVREYVGDTRTIATATSEQLRANQQPFVHLVQRRRDFDINGKLHPNIPVWLLENKGPGAAINVTFDMSIAGQIQIQKLSVGAIASGGEHIFSRYEHGDVIYEHVNIRGFVARYESLGGDTYETVGSPGFLLNDQIKTSVIRIAKDQ